MCGRFPDDGGRAGRHQRHQARRHPHDIGLPGIDGIEGTRQLRERFPDVPILALTVYDDDERVQRDLRGRVRYF